MTHIEHLRVKVSGENCCSADFDCSKAYALLALIAHQSKNEWNTGRDSVKCE